MQVGKSSGYDTQCRLIQALVVSMGKATASGNVRLLETHISWVLLAGRYAYKIKKAVNLGFLDFSSLQARKFYCEEEIRLNRRLAPQIYRDVIPVDGTVRHPELGKNPAIEYAVRMRRFPMSRQLDNLAEKNKIMPQHIDHLAAVVAEFHGKLVAVNGEVVFGSPDEVNRAAEQNFEQLQILLSDKDDLTMLANLHLASHNEFEKIKDFLGERRIQGFIRECHGDLHLGNIVMIGEQPVPFDGIEFNTGLRCIDVISEVAFTMMDLLHYQQADLAWRFLNAYLEITGDYAGMKLLRFYVAYRAMVRAKVNAIRVGQSDMQAAEKRKALRSCREYLQLADKIFSLDKPKLIITHGLPGSGKSTFAQLAVERLHAIRLRSDVERKRLFGLNPLVQSHASTGLDLYGSDISRQTYAKLHELASGLLEAGMTVIVDAAFLKQEERAYFRQLALKLKIPFVIVSIQASEATMQTRIVQRQYANVDPSDADINVLRKLRLAQDSLTGEEQLYMAEFVNENSGFSADAAGWNKLERMLERRPG